MKFELVPFPAEAKRVIEWRGGTCIAAYQCLKGDDFVGVIVSDDPSGEHGAIERHMSVSASTRGVRRMPRQREIKAAMDDTGVRAMSADHIVQGNMVVHVYQPLKTA